MLEQLFGSKLRFSVLSWLVLHPGRRYYVRQLERILRADSANLSRELSRLEKAGLLTSLVEGRQKYYRADTRCPVFPELQALIRKDLDLASLIRGSLTRLLDRIDIAFLTESRTPSNGTQERERELFVIGRCGRQEIEAAIKEVEERYGMRLVVSSMTAAEWISRLDSGERSATSAAARDKSYIVGDDDGLSGMLVRSRLTDAIESWVDRAHPGNDHLRRA